MTQSIPLTKGQFTVVDDTDVAWLNLWRWRLSSKGYAVRSYTVSGKETLISMQCEIMLPLRPLVVDHIDRDKLNNTRANLRLLTQQQNLWNRGLFKSNSTGFKGVTYQHGKWHARIETDGQTIHLGFHAELLTAALVYDCAAVRLFGDTYAYLNLPRKPFPPHIEQWVARYLHRYGF